MSLTEHQLQRAVAQYLDRALPPDAFWTSIDSAGRGPIQGARMKARGVKRGVADLLIIAGPGAPFKPFTVWVELKAPKGRWPVEQKRFSMTVERAGHKYFVCRSLDDVASVLENCGIPLRCKVSA